jgi:hypothetical protein
LPNAHRGQHLTPLSPGHWRRRQLLPYPCASLSSLNTPTALNSNDNTLSLSLQSPPRFFTSSLADGGGGRTGQGERAQTVLIPGLTLWQLGAPVLNPREKGDATCVGFKLSRSDTWMDVRTSGCSAGSARGKRIQISIQSDTR